MTLQRRLLVLLLVAVPAIWIIAVTVAVTGARSEINELFDTEQVRLAQQVMALLPAEAGGALPALRPPAQEPDAGGSAELEDMGIAVWSADGRVVVADREGRALPFRAAPTGFATTTVAGKPWTVYYLVSEAPRLGRRGGPGRVRAQRGAAGPARRAIAALAA